MPTAYPLERGGSVISHARGNEVVAVILAGGQGTRFGSDKPKQLAELNGRTVLSHTLSRFAASDVFTSCVIAANPVWYEDIQKAVDESLPGIETLLVSGGRNRNESVWNAISQIEMPDEGKLLIHDGVRPFVSEKLVRSVVDALDLGESVLPIIDSVDPLVSVEDGRVTDIESRQVVFRGQSPQGFRFGTIKRAFTAIGIDKVGEFSTIYEVLRLADSEAEIITVEGELDNIKITLPIDRIIAAELLLRDDLCV